LSQLCGKIFSKNKFVTAVLSSKIFGKYWVKAAAAQVEMSGIYGDWYGLGNGFYVAGR